MFDCLAQAALPGSQGIKCKQGGEVSLYLTITSYHKITPGQVPEISIDKGMLAIGRGPDNDWVLSDPERLVSSRHCTIQSKGDRYYLTDTSTNGVELVNAGARLRRGNSEVLIDGEVIRMGEYEISVRIDLKMKLMEKSVSGNNPVNSFESLIGVEKSAAPVAVEHLATQRSRDGAAQWALPDPFDFLSAPNVPAAAVPDHVPVEHHDFRPPVPQISVSHAQSMPEILTSAIPEDWNLPGEMSESVAETPVTLATELPAEMSVAVPATSRVDGNSFQAFQRGAGLEHLHIDPDEALAQMESIGRSYRLMVQGLIDVLRARSSLKGEFRLQQTMIRPVENNPLKFAPDADEALLLLLRSGNSAFMPADQAVADSFDDLRAHQLAVMAGVEAAIKALLKRFEPAQLEKRMGKPGALANFFGSRQAQHWQQFTELYAHIAREAEDDFQVLFGREFSRAYEEHSVRLRRS